MIGSGTINHQSCQGLTSLTIRNIITSMIEEAEKLFEDFVEKHADSRVIAISHHIQFLIDDIVKLELAELVRQQNKPIGFSGEEIMRKVMAANR